MATLVEVVKHGSALHVDASVQKLAGQLNKPNSAEVYPLHVAVWRNHLPIIERLLEAGALTHCTDGESGWTPLHRAVYLGHLAAAATLLQAGAAVDTSDLQGRTPVDLVSSELRRLPAEGAGRSSSIYSWGSGANYQLGTGSDDFHLNPLRVEALQGLGVVAVAAAKFHSAALTGDGRLLTWGWGRGGRLGHPEYNIHSGETALIHPWQVAGLGRRVVVSVAAGKHHMVVATSTGDIWSWGGNRDGKLGYPNVDTQPTPRKVEFRGRAALVAASNRHSACLTTAGEVWTWGANNEGQLGYGTSNSANNPTPRLVETMKGKALVALSLAKRHTVVLSAEGDAFTWGHRLVTPRRVPLAGCRDTARLAAVQQQQQQQVGGSGPARASAGAGGAASSATAAWQPGIVITGGGLDVRFHRNHAEVVRPEAALVAAGYSHTTVVTRSGDVLCWRSADLALRPQEVGGPLAGKRVVSVAAAKTRTVVVTDMGQVYMWECKEQQPQRTIVGGAASSGPGVGVTGGGAANKGTDAQGGSTGAAAAAAAAAGSAAGSGARGATAGAVTSLASTAAAAAGVPSGGNGVTMGLSYVCSSGGGGGGSFGSVEEAPAIVPVRVPGLTCVIQAAVGEKHTLALQAWTLPPMPDEHGVMPTLQRRRRQRRSDGSSGFDGSGSEDESCNVAGGWWRLQGKSFRGGGGGGRGGGGGGSGAATATVGSLTRGGLGLGSPIGLGMGPPPPLGSSPLARSLGRGADMIPSPMAIGSNGATAAAASLMGAFDRRERRQEVAAAAAVIAADDEFRGPGWELFSHRPAAADSSPWSCRRHSSAGGFAEDDGDEMFSFVDGEGGATMPSGRGSDAGLGGGTAGGPVSSLQVLCQRVVAAHLVDPRTALPILEYADVAGAMLLRCYCLAVAVANLDCTLVEAPGGLTGLPPHLLAELEHLYRTALLAPPPAVQPPAAPSASPALGNGSATAVVETTAFGVLGSSPPSTSNALYGSSLGGGSGGSGCGGYETQLAALEAFHRRRPLISRLQLGRRPTAAPAWLEGATATDRMAPQISSRLAAAALTALGAVGHAISASHVGLSGPEGSAVSGAAALAAGSAGAGSSEADTEVHRLAQNLQRKLQQITSLEELQRGGRQLDAQQHAKLSQRGALQEALLALAAGASVESVKQAIAHSAEVARKLAARPDATQALVSATVTTAMAAAGSGRAGGGTRGATASAGAAVSSAAQSVQQQQQQQSDGGGSGRRRGAKDASSAAGSGAPDAGAPLVSSASDSTATTVVPLPSDSMANSHLISQPPTGSAVGANVGPPPGTPVVPAMAGAPAGSSAGSAKKHQQRRGALSVFLSGALDQPVSLPPALSPPAATVPAGPKPPAWGGAKLPAAAAPGSSLRELLSQQPASSVVTAGPAQQQHQPLTAAASPAAPSRSSTGFGFASSGPGGNSLTARTPSGPLPLPLAAAAGASASSFPIAAAAGAALGGRKPTPSPFTTSSAKGTSTSPPMALGPTGASTLLASATTGSGAGSSSSVKLTLAEFMSGKPITAPQQMTSQRIREQEREPGGPAWGGVLGSSPVTAKSLLDIQAEQAQVQKRATAGRVRQAGTGGPVGAQASGVHSATPNAVVPAAAAAAAAAPAGSSPSMGRSLLLGSTQGGAPPSHQPSKWFIPEECQPVVAAKPLTAIQIEERAIKEITARYSGRVVARVVQHAHVDAAVAAAPAKSPGTTVTVGRTNSAVSAVTALSGSVTRSAAGGTATHRSKQKAAKGSAS
ncbi:hypothetical protein VaNZ11_007220 [Volvox africanus]|uniref:RCC1-like domain-containing protein n=1 Tax=Volvox africanus TaxID=51714 RepID=A0ABQ5S3B4_9CHLO|nr:hypothetical protein VaNZ11_007220 [Volvox africanus]